MPTTNTNAPATATPTKASAKRRWGLRVLAGAWTGWCLCGLIVNVLSNHALAAVIWAGCVALDLHNYRERAHQRTLRALAATSAEREEIHRWTLAIASRPETQFGGYRTKETP